MRDLIFRGQRCDNGEWVYGYLVKKHDPLLGIAYSFILVQEMDHSCITGEPTILRSEMTWFKVDPKSVGEFTGLTDKNGTRIFEGDIVEFRTRTSSFKPLYVQYHKETAQFVASIRSGVRSYPMDATWEYEVIGNIHDNPELIGERKDNA